MLNAKKMFLQNSYEPLKETEEFLISHEGVRVDVSKDSIVFHPSNSNGMGIIFYPGAKVVFSSYAPILFPLAKEGYTAILLKMPEDLANLGINRADEIYSQFPKIQKWYLGGHSLGGSTAAKYVHGHYPSHKIAGLFLLGSYSIQDFKDTDLSMLIIYAEKDEIVSKERIFTYQDRFSKKTSLKEIAGGNHSFFGSYGEQLGDGAATISRKEQQNQVVSSLLSFFQT